MSIVTTFNSIRAQSEGDINKARDLATQAGLSAEVIEYITLATSWRAYELAFRALCAQMVLNDGLDPFWRGAAAESLGATTPADQVPMRMTHFDTAAQFAARCPEGSEERLYLLTCTHAGRLETAGQRPSVEQLRQVATVMVSHGWFNAPGRLKAYLEGMQAAGGTPSSTLTVVIEMNHRLTSGDHNFSPRQLGFMRGAFPALFPTP